jgi:hypothetical protein
MMGKGGAKTDKGGESAGVSESFFSFLYPIGVG